MKKHPKENAVKPMETLIKAIVERPLIRFIPTAVTLACFWLAPLAQAVVPAPNGDYPGFNTAAGQKALLSLTSGGGNTAIGSFSLLSNTEGSFNTGVGAGTLLFNVGDQSTRDGVNNTAIGAAALLFNTTGYDNAAVGTQALFSNTEGAANTATGYQALVSNTTAGNNTAFGYRALAGDTIGSNNTANGAGALVNNTTGNQNTASGAGALINNTTGNNNTASGFNALVSNTTGGRNAAFGAGAGSNVTTADNVIAIGAGGANVSDSCFIGNIWNQASPGGTAVFVNSDGKLGITTSSRRFKEDIKPMDKASEALLALNPVTFHYKKEIDPAARSQFGLVAEEVEKVNPDLVVHGKDARPYTVRYEQVNAMLLNEFLKQHKKVEKLEATLESVTARLQEQAAQIQKVTAQVDATKPLSHLVLNNL